MPTWRFRPATSLQAWLGVRNRNGHDRTRPTEFWELKSSVPQLRQTLGSSGDIVFQPFVINGLGVPAVVVYVEGLAKSDTIHLHILERLMTQQPPANPPQSLAELGQRMISISSQQTSFNLNEVRDQVYRGFAALLLDGFPGVLLLDVQGWEERPVQSPPTESALRGPRDGFIENVSRNIALIRRRLCDPSLQITYFHVGQRGKTRVALLHLSDLARPAVVHELTTRIKAIRFDSILDANQLREMLVGQGSSLFPKMEGTERPDKVVSALLSGKVAVLVDNSPFVLTAPSTLMDSLWAPDDYYISPVVTLLVRLVRVAGWLAAVALSPLYIATQMYNPDLLRGELVLFLSQERMGIPLNAALEIYFLELMMEMIHEATIRLPAKVGSAATVVGGLIVGQAAVQANILSSVVVIVVAISAIGSFTMPGQEIGQVWRTVKWLLIIAASVFGIYGVFATGLILYSWIASQDSFGTPYMTPLSPLVPRDLFRDFLYRKPWGSVQDRAVTYRPLDPDRTPAPQEAKYRDGGER